MQIAEVEVNEEGFQLPNGEMYRWSEVAVTLKLEANINLDTKQEVLVTFHNIFDGDTGRQLLIAILKATCEGME